MKFLKDFQGREKNIPCFLKLTKIMNGFIIILISL